METSKLLVLCLIVGIVVGINAVLFAGFRRPSLIRGLFGDIEMYRKASQTARDPWRREDDDLSELSSLVKELKKGSTSTDDLPDS